MVWKYGHCALLLDRGADINLVGGEYGTALALAVSGEKKDIVSLLLDRGAEINMAVGGQYGSALAVALAVSSVERGKDTVDLLMDQGADINLVANELGTVRPGNLPWENRCRISSSGIGS